MRIAGILLFAGVLGAQTDWPFYGHDAAGQRYSPLARINAKNASKPLRAGWT
jgi:glucose dehydrogenase